MCCTCISHTSYTPFTFYFALYHSITTTAVVFMIIDGVCGDDGDQGPELRPQQPHQGDLVPGIYCDKMRYMIQCTIQCTTLHVMCIHMLSTGMSLVLCVYTADQYLLLTYIHYTSTPLIYTHTLIYSCIYIYLSPSLSAPRRASSSSASHGSTPSARGRPRRQGLSSLTALHIAYRTSISTRYITVYVFILYVYG